MFTACMSYPRKAHKGVSPYQQLDDLLEITFVEDARPVFEVPARVEYRSSGLPPRNEPVLPTTRAPPAFPTNSSFTKAGRKLNIEAALKPLLRASYMTIDQAEVSAKTIGYTLVRDMSTVDTFVYTDPDGHAVVVHRGSVTAGDWLLEDLLIASGMVALAGSPRLRQAVALTQRVEARFGPASAMGHSLGGFLAEHSGAHGHIFTLNKAVGPAQARKTISPNQTDYRDARDVVSIMAEGQTRTGEPMQYLDRDGRSQAHSIDRRRL